MYGQEFTVSEQQYIDELRDRGKDGWINLHEKYPSKNYIYLILRVPEFRNQLKAYEYSWYAKRDEKAAVYCCTDFELSEKIGKWGLLQLGEAYPKAARALLDNEVAQSLLGSALYNGLIDTLNKKSPIDLPSRFFLQPSTLRSPLTLSDALSNTVMPLPSSPFSIAVSTENRGPTFPFSLEEKIELTNSSLNKNEENMNITVLNHFRAELSVSHFAQMERNIVLVRMDQSILAEGEEGFKPDFDIIEQENKLVITGNLRTYLICLRHTGLLHPNFVEEVINQLEKIKISPEDDSLWQLYSNNYNQTLKTFPIKYSAPYPRS